MRDRPGNRAGFVAAASWLAFAAGLLLISNGRWIVPAATWLAPAALLVFLERARPRHALPVALVAYVLVQFIAWWDLIPAPGFLYFLIAGTYGFVYFIPFVVHRILAPRTPGLLATLVFPVAWVTIEFLFHRWGTPYGSWFSLTYTQVGSLTLLQLASVTGTWGISFLITWFASVLAWTIRTGTAEAPDWPTAKRLSVTFAIVLLTVLVAGHVRLSIERDSGALVRTAGLVPNGRLMGELETALVPVRRGESVSESTLDSITVLAGRLNDDLFARSRREAEAGARLVTWSETAGRIFDADEPQFLRRAGGLAAEHAVTLLLAYGVWYPNAEKPFGNKVVAIDARGAVRWHYQKAHPIVGAESFVTPGGDGIVRSIEFGDGRLGAVICHDLDFPRLLAQAGDSGIGLVVGPSADWPVIAPLHADMAVVRAVEGGFSLLRPTSGGRSLAVDTRGRTLTTVDFADDAMVAYLSMKPSPTVYGAVGDLFAWLCVAVFVTFIAASIRASRRR